MKKIILLILIIIISGSIIYYKTRTDCYQYAANKCPLGCTVERACISDQDCPECDVCIELKEQCVEK